MGVTIFNPSTSLGLDIKIITGTFSWACALGIGYMIAKLDHIR
jgi:hypothetical protein